MLVPQFSRRVRNELIRVIHGGRPADDEAQNMICLKNAICAETMNEHVASLARCLSADPRFEPNHIYASSFAGRPP